VALPTGSAIFAAAMSYELDGKQYVVIPAGSALIGFGVE